jgi:Flp pilus assembly protein TadB
MKNLFKLSNIYIGLLAFVLLLASCSRRDLSQGNIGNDKLEKLSAEIESSHASASLASPSETDEVKVEEQAQNAAPGRIYSSMIENKRNVSPLMAFKAIKEAKKLTKQQELKNDPLNNKESKVRRRGSLSQRMKIGIILAVVGLLVAVLIPWPLYIIGVVLFIIGAVLIIMDLIDY